jgi:hypothetical protein
MKQVHLDRFDPDLPTVLLAVHAQAANAVAGNRLFRLPIRMQPLECFVCWHATADADAGGADRAADALSRRDFP